MNLHDLRASLPAGSTNHSILWTMKIGDEKPTQVKELDVSKPCVFFFGGGAYLSKGEESVSSQVVSTAEILSPIPDSAYNFYTLTSDEAGSKALGIGIAGKKNHVYNDNPQVFFSKEAEAFVSNYLLPFVKSNHDTKENHERAKNVTETAKKFSAITILGFSYGTAFVQEVRNALHVALKEEGYTDKEQATVMKAIAAINIGPTFKYTPKYPDISQSTFVLSSDKDAVRYSGINLSNPEIDFTHTKHGLAHANNESHTIVLVENGSTRLAGIGYQAIAKDVSLNDAIHSAKNWAETSTPKEDVPAIVNRVVKPHHKGLQTSNLRWDADTGSIYYTFPSNLVGTNSVRFFQAAVSGSNEAITTGGVRDSDKIMQACVTKHLNTQAVEKDLVQTQFFKQMFKKISGQECTER